MGEQRNVIRITTSIHLLQYLCHKKPFYNIIVENRSKKYSNPLSTIFKPLTSLLYLCH